MQKLLQYILPFESLRNYPENTFGDLYIEWDKPSRQIQISAITCLTALLYVVFAFVEKSWASEQVQTLMLKLQVLIIVPSLLTISFFAYKQRFYKIVMPALAVHSIIAMCFHTYIASQLSNNAFFLAEGYLLVFWIFVVSGMTYRYALFSAIVSSIVLLVSSFYYIENTDAYIMHSFWVLCSFSFGFLGALIFDSSRKAGFVSQQKLYLLATTDPLTGAFNRNQLNVILSREIERGLRYDKNFGLILLDIDHFKTINDTHGHDGGDKVLKQITQVISKAIRGSDMLFRWGGEEFIVILIEVDEKSIIQLSNKLLTEVENQDYSVPGKITVSIGATLYREHDTQDKLIARADKALYEAKEKGRNMTVYVE